jgi:zinc-ribbon domain
MFSLECGCAEEIQPESIEEEKMMRTIITKGCLYCGLQLPEHADFCPECGRPLERGRVTHATQKSESGCLHTEIKGKNDLVRQQEASSDCNDTPAHETTRIRDEHVNLIGTLTMVATRKG